MIKYILLALCGLIGILLFLLIVAVLHTLLTPRKKSNYVPQPDEQRALGYAEKLSRMGLPGGQKTVSTFT